MFSEISLPVPSQQMTMFRMRVARGRMLCYLGEYSRISGFSVKSVVTPRGSKIRAWAPLMVLLPHTDRRSLGEGTGRTGRQSTLMRADCYRVLLLPSSRPRLPGSAGVL